ncbi:MAG: leucine-rich repeat domain-containing protein [Paraprevotella sp.]|nr:leucine-rich repeat domain-containing protein [Paraprevotella sp.]
MGHYVFGECTRLTSIEVQSDNSNYSSENGVLYNKDKTILLIWPAGKTDSFIIPSSVASIGDNAFSGCRGLTSINIPSSITDMGRYAFYNCNELTSVTIPSSVTSIKDGTFAGCSKLTSINIPSSVTNIGNYAFSFCIGLTSIIIPSSVANIGEHAFCDCSGLTSLTIPSSVTNIGKCAFANCTLKPLLFYAKTPHNYTYCFNDLNRTSTIFAYSSEINAIQNYWHGTVVDIEIPYAINIPIIYLCGVSFNFVAYEHMSVTLLSVKIGNNNTPYKEIEPDENGLYTVTGLDINTTYNIEVTYQNANGEISSFVKEIMTQNPTIPQIKKIKTTQTTATIWVEAKSDKTYTPKIRYEFNGKNNNCIDNKITLSNLIPGKSYPIKIFADYNITLSKSATVMTNSLNPAITLQKINPTSISLAGSYTIDDAHVSETGFQEQYTGDLFTLTNLDPNTTYTVSYYVKTREGSNETTSQTFTTPALELTTLQPRCVSSSCAIVAASTNISEEETNVGFQWKKYDAPASLKPNEGYSAIYDGQLEGYIRNLQPTSYYNVRAFYKSAAGNYYYGAWVTFDPSDFSYFEPTVHTYAAEAVTANSARVKGYVLAGTDEIEEQGFEYWPTGTDESQAKSVRATKAETETDGIQTVFATGQVMTAELRDLRSATTYCLRAFVKTAAGKTYGEEQTFTTPGLPTDITEAATSTTTPTVEGYYDLNGRKFNAPQRGINIIRYSNGTTRKIVVR